jgi:RHS repeat-associated protein
VTTNYYDSTGDKVAVTGASGNPATCDPTQSANCADTAYYTYDLAGQVTEITYTDGTPTVSYAYGQSGQLCWMYQGVSTNSCASPPSGATSYGYDTMGRLVSITNSAGATVTYGYDANSNVACVSYPNASNNTCSSSGNPTGVVRYTYNQFDQLQSLTDWAGNTLTFTYNADGEECWVSTYAPSSPSCASRPQASGYVTTTYGYDSSNNISDIATSTGTSGLLDLSVGSSRNANHFITQETPTIGSTAYPSDSYSYNSSDQVASGPITGSGSSNTYVYTPAGGVTTDTNAFASAAYDQAGVLCWTSAGSSTDGCSSPPSGATSFSYNADGERTSVIPASGNPASYGWDTLSGELVCANTNGTTCSTSNPTSSTTVYTYDGNGLRSSATISSTTTNFTWGTVSAGSPKLLSDGTWDYVYVGDNPTPIEQIATSGSSPSVDELLFDENGNARGLVQLSSGTHQDQLVNYTEYDAYGNPITQSGGSPESGGLTVPQTSLNSNWVGSTPWAFGAGYLDPTGLEYLVHRYYDPTTGQFVSSDPLVSVTNQPYDYAADNPINGADPRGAWVVYWPTAKTAPNQEDAKQATMQVLSGFYHGDDLHENYHIPIDCTPWKEYWSITQFPPPSCPNPQWKDASVYNSKAFTINDATSGATSVNSRNLLAIEKDQYEADDAGFLPGAIAVDQSTWWVWPARNEVGKTPKWLDGWGATKGFLQRATKHGTQMDVIVLVPDASTPSSYELQNNYEATIGSQYQWRWGAVQDTYLMSQGCKELRALHNPGGPYVGQSCQHG